MFKKKVVVFFMVGALFVGIGIGGLGINSLNEKKNDEYIVGMVNKITDEQDAIYLDEIFHLSQKLLDQEVEIENLKNE